MEIIFFAIWLWLTVLGALIGLAGDILALPGHMLGLLGDLIVEFAEGLEP